MVAEAKKIVDDILKQVGRNIRHQRKAAGLSQEKLGFLCGLHRTYVGAIERGEENPSVKTLEKIAIALQVSVRDLFDG